MRSHKKKTPHGAENREDRSVGTKREKLQCRAFDSLTIVVGSCNKSGASGLCTSV